MPKPKIIFFRGLNTYGHDQAQLSFVRFGPMFKHMRRELVARDVDFYPVLGMGAGPWAAVTTRARAALEASPAWRDPARSVHLVGHSAGGLVARLIAHELADARRADGAPKIASLLTIATPHRGSALAARLCDLVDRGGGGGIGLLRALGFDLRRKLEVLRTLTPAVVSQTLATAERSPPHVGSILCAAPRARWSRTMRAIHSLGALRGFDQLSDGIVERASQPFGAEVCELEIDHFQQAGFCGGRVQFRAMCAAVDDFVRRAEAAPADHAPVSESAQLGSTTSCNAPCATF